MKKDDFLLIGCLLIVLLFSCKKKDNQIQLDQNSSKFEETQYLDSIAEYKKLSTTTEPYLGLWKLQSGAKYFGFNKFELTQSKIKLIVNSKKNYTYYVKEIIYDKYFDGMYVIVSDTIELCLYFHQNRTYINWCCEDCSESQIIKISN